MKAKVVTIIGVVVLAGALIFAMRPKSFDQEFAKVMKNMDSYILEGDMEISRGEDSKNYGVKVTYLKGEKDAFKVSLLDKDLKQEQIILRNAKGVFVITPSLNQVFKFEGDWPMNSPKPYLLQTMAELVSSESAKITSNKKGVLVKNKVNYPNNKNFDHQEMHFDQDGVIKWVNIYNQDHNSECKIVFSKVNYDAKLKAKSFKEPKTLAKSNSEPTLTELDLPLYPMEVYDATLQNKSVMEIGNEQAHVLEYVGEKSFTLVQTAKTSNEQTQTTIMPGQILDALDVIGFYDGSQVSVIMNGIEYSVFSEELGPDEMMSVIQSMHVAVMK